MNLARFTEASDAPNLDIDDAARADLDGLGSMTGVANGFVQTNCSTQFRLQLGVIEDIVVPQGLLNHQQIELVELAQMFDLIQGVRGVGVAAQQNIWPARTDFLQDV
jgi:hypothetical protein